MKNKNKVFYGQAVYDKREINASIRVLKNQKYNLIDSVNVKKLEKKVCEIFGKKYGLMVNSGSSANLLALHSLNLPKGSEIITPTLTFSTTVAPIYLLGLVPSFIDVEKNTFVADIKQIEKQITKKTKAIMIPNLIGNVPDWYKIKQIARKHKLILIEDSADTIGFKLKNKNTGKLSDMVINSFYASHIINGAGFGGIVCFNDKKLYERAKLLRGWGRSSAVFNESEEVEKRFKNVKLSGIKYDAKYIFNDFGYNFLPSEISAAFALEQIKKLKNNVSLRIKNFNFLHKFYQKLNKYFDIATLDKRVRTAWLAFPLIVKQNKYFDRTDLQIFFEKNNIQTRTIFTGNILKQPMMKNKKYKSHKLCGVNSTEVMKRGMLLGCHQGLKMNDLKYICSKTLEFLKKYKLI
jgi:CDP-6-deoxy-D-xylo-4-hexulose-3-dehydrase